MAKQPDLHLAVNLTHREYDRWTLHVRDVRTGHTVEQKCLDPVTAVAFVEGFMPNLAETARKLVREDVARAEERLEHRRERAEKDAADALRAVIDLEREAHARREELAGVEVEGA